MGLGRGPLRPTIGAVLAIALLGIFGILQNMSAVRSVHLRPGPAPLASSSPASDSRNSVIGEQGQPRFCEAAAVRRDVEFNGVRHFHRKCLVAARGSDRLSVVDPTKLADKEKGAVFAPGTSFLVRDVCALGHFPKDLTHLHTYEELAAATAQQKLRGLSSDDSRAAENVSFVIVGDKCATLDPRRLGSKRTPVFHNVLLHWLRAITGEYDLLQQAMFRPAGSRLVMYEDYLAGGSAPSVCFEHLVEREERWRWFPSPRLADSFREKMWRYLGLDYEAVQLRRRTVPFDKQPKVKIVVLRRDEDRHFEERKAVAFLQSKFGKVASVRFEQYDSPPDPRKATPESNVTVASHVDQLRQLFDTDILIAAHGAGLSSIVAMQPGSVVVELFPNGFRYYMYEELARVMSLTYTAYESEVVSPPNCCRGRMWAEAAGQQDVAAAAVDVGTPLDLVYGLHGKRDCKKCDVHLPDGTLYQIVKNALATVWLRNSRLTNVHDFDVRR
jgi:hypothetical protein